jgi:uncharacterized protein DUF2852
MSTAERYDDYRGYRQDRWCGPSVRFHPGWIVLMILGFIFWWPIGLAILAFTIWSRNMGCYGSDRWQRKMERMEEKMGRMRERMQGFGGGGFGGGPWGAPRSSGNHAFDEYRTETLRRLEEEQREFRDFLDRLRFAKDKSEFDQFMAERRNRPQPPVPPAPQPQS